MPLAVISLARHAVFPKVSLAFDSIQDQTLLKWILTASLQNEMLDSSVTFSRKELAKLYLTAQNNMIKQTTFCFVVAMYL